MADASKLKRKSSLGSPPSAEEASHNLHEPEVAPTIPAPAYIRTVDGRSRRRTNRTMQLNLKVSPEFDSLLREIADREGLLLAEVLEKALNLYNSR
jgi:hypothetical protein